MVNTNKYIDCKMGLNKNHQNNTHKISKKIKILIISLILISAIPIAIYTRSYIISEKLLYCQEYISGTGNIKGDVDVEEFTDISSNFDIGANAYGYAVFKDPEAALEELKKDYSLGITLIQEEFNLDELSQENYDLYGAYGDQITTGTEEAIEQAIFVSGFMDIYENSFVVYKEYTSTSSYMFSN